MGASVSCLCKYTELQILVILILKDLEGQTALHYAAVCERKDIAEFLVKHGADVEIKDNEGDCPRDVCELHWPWLQQATADN